MQINVQNIEVYAMLNYLRDKAYNLCPEENWNNVREEYIKEAKQDPNIVLSVAETQAIINLLEK